jgi:hypothetical protein
LFRNLQFKISKLKLGHFGMEIRNTWKILKYGAGKRRRRAVGHIV